MVHALAYRLACLARLIIPKQSFHRTNLTHHPLAHPHLPLPQHPEVCGVSIHPECTGLPFPTGPYICINHESGQLDPRARRRSARSAGLLEDAGGEEESSDEETASEGGEGGSDGGSSKGGKGRRKGASDSEATISEETDSLSSSGTEDEGTSKRRRKR